MELKPFQKRVIEDLTFFLKRRAKTNAATAYKDVWKERYNVDISDPRFSFDPYESKPGIPFSACIKVPTGGGKTFVGINAIKPILEYVPSEAPRAVVWLVPSDTILTQTLDRFKNTEEAYHQKFRQLFGNVAFYGKEELLSGTGFNWAAVKNQVSVCVLSYDSFKSNKKDGLRATRENSQLQEISRLSEATGAGRKVEGVDDTALLQVLNNLNPAVVVDESHHAKTPLSWEMLCNFNPRFVLELTATPKKGSNIISCANALELKKEHLIKLPVILYNLPSSAELLATAVSLRQQLLRLAENTPTQQKRVKPIVLFQAQPKIGAESETTDKLKDKLKSLGIPEDEIAIQTAKTKDLEKVDLSDPNEKVNYVITVNALKEGWDCPNAYILASVANKNSKVDVEQILGRVLRQPNAVEHPAPALNLAYVLTSSNDFQSTIQGVINGLTKAGFSRNDYHAEDLTKSEPSVPPADVNQPTKQTEIELKTKVPSPEESSDESKKTDEDGSEDALNVTLEEFKAAGGKSSDIATKAIQDGAAAQKAIKKTIETQGDDTAGLTAEVCDNMKSYYVRKEFEADVRDLTLPTIGVKEFGGLFGDTVEPLSEAHLMKGFVLANKDASITLDQSQLELVAIDATEEGTASWKGESQNRQLQALLKSNLTLEAKREEAVRLVIKACDQTFDCISTTDLREYVKRVVSGLDSWQLQYLLDDHVPVFITLLRRKITGLTKQYRQEQFDMMSRTRQLVPIETYKMPEYFEGIDWNENAAKSLYYGEEPGNSLEQELVRNLTGIDNVVWWHRNPYGKKCFYINGPVKNHYPDFIVRVRSGKIIMIETKGDQLGGFSDTLYKQRVGEVWEKTVGDKFSYYMVFLDGNNKAQSPNVLSMQEIVETLQTI